MCSTIRCVEVVNVLLRDPVLIKHWVLFVDSLGLGPEEFLPLKRQYYNGNLTVYELFSELLSSWIRRNGSEATLKKLIRILNEIKFRQCADRLHNKFNPLSQIVTHASSGVPVSLRSGFGLSPAVPNFTGRESELAQLNTILNTGVCRFVVVAGLAGVGKTELAKKFISELKDDRAVVCWLSGETADILRSGITKFSEFLGIPATEGDIPISSAQLVQNIYKLEGDPGLTKWVVAIDDVDEVDEEITQVTNTIISFPQSFVILISRRKDIFPESECVELLELEDHNAVAFVKASLGTSINESEVLVLCQAVQNFPLALQQAMEYIKEQQRSSGMGKGFGIPQYLDHLSEFRTTMGNQVSLWNSTLTVWDLAIDKIKSNTSQTAQLAYKVLEVMALVNGSGIHFAFLKKLVSTVSPDEGFSEAVRMLGWCCLVLSDNSMLTIDRVVQIVIRRRMEHTSNFEHDPRATTILTTILNGLDTSGLAEMEIRHVQSIWQHAARHPTIISQFPSLPNLIVKRLIELERISEAHNFTVLNLKLLQMQFGSDNIQTLEMEGNMAATLRRMGRDMDALNRYEGAFEKQQRLLRELYCSTVVAVPNPAPVVTDMDTDELSGNRDPTKYEVLGFLGAGSFGFVFKIQKPQTLVPTALKILVSHPPQVGESPELALKAILEDNKELKAMKSLIHENVVQLRDSAILPATDEPILQIYGKIANLNYDNQYHYQGLLAQSKLLPTIIIEMDLCGPSLRQWINKNDTLGQMAKPTQKFASKQLKIAHCIINGIGYIHSKGMMHRDLKPENIYFSDHDFQPHVKIGDFGLSRQMSSDASQTMTAPRGTPLYRAPEVAQGRYGPQADLFSMGLVLWEIFQVNPFTYNNHAHIVHLTFGRDKYLIKRNHLVPNLRDTIYNLTAWKTEDRTKSVENVELALGQDEEYNMC